MGDGILLTDLCKICNNKPPKYCCPRCRSLTCSLPCYKRHQIWSQCSGKRDPAAYMKRSQLATPAGIDHDYNFLTGIERAFDQADRFAASRGISLEGNAGKRRPANPRLARSIDTTGVIIYKAPSGMSRQKRNATQIDQTNGEDFISWTIEWILPDRSRKTKNSADFHLYRDAYNALYGQTPSTRRKKRKREKVALESSGDSRKSLEPLSEKPQDEIKLGLHDRETELMNAHVEPHNEPRESSEAEPYFYLFRPLTTGTTVVLIPLSPSMTIRDSLRNRMVLEFPTIHVLYEAPHELPQGFQLERDYIVQTRNMVKELDEELTPILGDATVESGQDAFTESSSADPVFEESRIMESLQRDLAAARDN